jgi:hypothetical protein
MLRPEDITIAVTVYDRKEFVFQAVHTALSQTIPVKVMLVEDCGPRPELGTEIRATFGDRVRYIRNPRRRGLFDNWNACLEACQTPWISILHDDDYLDHTFVVSMLDLERTFPDRGLYFSQAASLNPKGACFHRPPERADCTVALEEFTYRNPVLFAGTLFQVADARAVGGFRKTSLYCGDVEMWTRLTALRGAARSGKVLAFVREHTDWSRGTSRAERGGKRHGLVAVQSKRTIALLHQQGTPLRFDRRELLRVCPVSIASLIRSAHGYTPRFLRYNTQLLKQSTPPNLRYGCYRSLVLALGEKFVRACSLGWRWLRGGS